MIIRTPHKQLSTSAGERVHTVKRCYASRKAGNRKKPKHMGHVLPEYGLQGARKPSSQAGEQNNAANETRNRNIDCMNGQRIGNK